MTAHGIGRRRVIAGSAGLGLATPLLAACGGDEGGGETASDPATSQEGDQGGSGGGGAIASTADVPVGGGAIVEDEELVITQPAEGDFKAFSSICTHQGCPVNEVTDNEIICPCHGSIFSAEDGSVVNGPATAPLEEVSISVEGEKITRA